MIKTIELENFQPHHNTKITLHPSVNVIQGLSDSGKSALLRGIDAVLRRTPFYLTFNKDSGKNTITFDNNDVISRSFTKTKLNKCPSCKEKITSETQVCESCGEFLPVKSSDEFYMINDEKRDRFGKTLPEFITDVTKIKPIEFLDNEIFLNFAKQHEPMFFVSETYSGSLRNKMISLLLPDSDKIDSLIKELNSEKLSTSANIKVYSKQQANAEETLNLINMDFTEAENAFNMLSGLEIELRQAEHKLNSMVALQSQLNKVSPLVKLSTTIATFNKKITTAIQMLDNAQEIENQLKTLKSLDSGLQSLSKYANIDLLEFALLGSVGDDLNDLVGSVDKVKNLVYYESKLKGIKTVKLPTLPNVSFPTDTEFKHDQLVCVLSNYETIEKRLIENEKLVGDIKKEMTELQKELNDDKMLCPITNKPFCKECVEALKHDLM